MWALDRDCFPPGIAYSRSALRAFLSRKTAVTIVAERGGRLIAFVLGWMPKRIEGHVITLDVVGWARRQGVGRWLMIELERRFRAAGVRRVQLEVAVSNTTAIAFYEGLGYRTVRRLAHYYGRGLPAWKMAKALARPRVRVTSPRSGAGRVRTAADGPARVPRSGGSAPG
jgi:ribosomal-protein-alanine N-acetyltransferase